MNVQVRDDIGAERLTVRRQTLRLAVAACLLAVCFGRPLLDLMSFAWQSELFSYVPLIPFISGYLIWANRSNLRLESVRPCWPGAALGFIAGGAIVAGYWIGRQGGWMPQPQDYLMLMTLALLCCVWGACLTTLGLQLSGQIFFPLAFLAFAVPMPVVWMAHIDTFFQYTSAAASEAFYRLAGEPVVRDGLDLQLSGFGLTVAPECSGIHSTLVLFITSMLAGYLFLRRFWTRAALVLAVVPLAILRNGFRIFVVGWLCVHKGHEMINSPIHRKGGPLFFALSLIPFFLWLALLRKKDSQTNGISNAQPES
jgi:exosortase C (VPDSG-CTERM-specific)